MLAPPKSIAVTRVALGADSEIPLDFSVKKLKFPVGLEESRR